MDEDGDAPVPLKRKLLHGPGFGSLRAARHREWLLRERPGKQTGLRRPLVKYRMAARKWCRVVDNQIRVCTIHRGLSFFKKDPESPLWRDWRFWPGLGVASDLGSDGNAGLHALMYTAEMS